MFQYAAEALNLNLPCRATLIRLEPFLTQDFVHEYPNSCVLNIINAVVKHMDDNA